jgi:hypothetical protein
MADVQTSEVDAKLGPENMGLSCTLIRCSKAEQLLITPKKQEYERGGRLNVKSCMETNDEPLLLDK